MVCGVTPARPSAVKLTGEEIKRNRLTHRDILLDDKKLYFCVHGTMRETFMTFEHFVTHFRTERYLLTMH